MIMSREMYVTIIVFGAIVILFAIIKIAINFKIDNAVKNINDYLYTFGQNNLNEMAGLMNKHLEHASNNANTLLDKSDSVSEMIQDAIIKLSSEESVNRLEIINVLSKIQKDIGIITIVTDELYKDPAEIYGSFIDKYKDLFINNLNDLEYYDCNEDKE